MKIFNYLLNNVSKKGAAFLILIDPDKIDEKNFHSFLMNCQKAGVDAFLVGGSLMIKGNLPDTIRNIKDHCSIPVIIFPGGVDHISPEADALLFISLISGRNAEQLIGKQVLSAPIIKKYNIETISTGYILVEGGNYTTAEYMSGSKPIPRNKPEIAVATALAAQYIGMKIIYLEAGSGAELTVPEEMIKMVSKNCNIPIIVGGGIKNPETAGRKVKAGAKLIVIGNHFEDKKNWKLIEEFSKSIHYKIK
jgi:putative glycerol-1-phosphate prenyltransferase